MGKIYSPPKEVGERPKFSIKDIQGYQEQEKQYTNSIIEWAKKNGKGEFAGEIIRFPVADGYAQYVVLSCKPVQLIHLPIGDAWHFQYANRLTATDIKAEVTRQRKFAELFSGNKNKK